MRLYGVILLAALSGTVMAEEVNLQNKDVLLYEPCESLKSENAGVKFSDSIVVEEKGKFGKALRIERRTLNVLDNGDFAKENSDSWICRDNTAEWLSDGGIGNSASLQLNGGEISVPITGLKAKAPNAFSFYVRRVDNAPDTTSIRVNWQAGGKTLCVLNNYMPGKTFERIKLPLSSDADSGTITLVVNGAVVIDNAQFDKGVSYFNSFSQPLVMRGVDVCNIPADGKYLNPEKGSISCWLKVPWFDKSLYGEMMALIQVQNAEQQKAKWGDYVMLSISCIPNTVKGDSSGTLNAYLIDAENRVVAIGENLNNINVDLSSEWHLLVFTWEVKDGKAAISLNIDGGKTKLTKEQPFGPLKKPALITAGYVAGAYLNGQMDDLAIFNRPLNEAEITEIYKSSQPLSALLK
ncbi:MAG: LamG-like jellyroll fold domain-containing protein [Lentisphaerota bacterium]